MVTPLIVLVETVETGVGKLVIVGRITPPESDDDDDVDEAEVFEFVLLVVIGGRLELDEGLGGEVVELLLLPEDDWLELDEIEL